MFKNRIILGFLICWCALFLANDALGNPIKTKPLSFYKYPFAMDSNIRFPVEFETFENAKRMLAFKLEPTLIFSGDFPVFAEFKVNNKLSLELGLGFTNYEFNHFYDDNSNYAGILESGEDPKSGYSFRLAPRYYIPKIDVAISGLYISPEIMYRKYMLLEKYRISSNTDDYFWSDYIQRSLSLNVGYQKIFSSNVLLNVYMGLAFRKIKDEDLVKASNGYYDGKTSINNSSSGSFLIGVKFGYCFR